MATEPLYVPEEKLEEVIKIIRSGLKHEKVSKDTREGLEQWCDEEERYLKQEK